MKIRFIASIVLATSFSFSSTANAATVFADGKEWLQVTESTNMSYNDMGALCSSATGICGAGWILGGTDLHGWTWADNAAVASLFDSYIGTETITSSGGGGPYSKHTVNSLFAPTLLSEFDATYISTGAELIFGLTRDLLPGTNLSLALVQNYFSISGPADAARIDSWGATSSYSDPVVGHWIYRDVSAVPIPAAVFMFAPGLLGFFGFRRKVKNTIT